MKIPVQLTIIMSALFAVICCSVAYTGFNAPGTMTDPTKVADAKDFAWFWSYLGIICVIFGALSYWMVRTLKNDEDN